MKMAIMNRFDSGLVLDLSCKPVSPVTKQEPTTPPHYYTTPEPVLQYSPELNPSRLQVVFQHAQRHLQYPQQQMLVSNLQCYDDDRIYNRVPSYSPTKNKFSYSAEAAMQPTYLNTQRTSTHDEFSETSSINSGSSSQSPTLYSKSIKESKATRPFKAYLKDPFTMAAGFTSADTILNDQSATRFSEFRNHMLDQIRKANGGQTTVTNPKMRRTVKRTHAESGGEDDLRKDVSKDNTYIEKRMKNNEAAKKSRDRRRIKEDEIAIRAAFLERENIKLKFELAAARKQLTLYGVAQ